MKPYKRKVAIGIVAMMVLVGIATGLTSTVNNSKNISMPEKKYTIDTNQDGGSDETEGYLLDSYVREDPDASTLTTTGGIVNDAGYNTDVGNNILKALPIYPGEIKDGAPGRGTTGSLDPTGRDTDDWYYFSVCEGQQISMQLTADSNFMMELANTDADVVATGTSITYTADATGNWFMHIYGGEGAEKGNYTFDVTLNGQNDAGSGQDAGNSLNSAMSITPGSYTGYMDMNDQEDWYSFSVNSGQGIFVTVKPLSKSDYDVHLYNPSGEEVYYKSYYGEDNLEYPADVSGTWAIKIDMFPGWDTSKWPDDYFLYGSGAYELTLSIGGSAKAPPGPIPQPDITPVAQTFIVNYDDASNKDDYAYIAAIPAANYIDDGKRYVSPIVYKGCDYIPTWFTTVDQTTQYLLDDWNTYLARHGVTATEYTLDSDPVKAAANIATTKWASSSTAVIAVDGSDFEDEIETIFDQDVSLSSTPSTTALSPDSPKFKDIGGNLAVPMFLGKSVGAIHLVATGDSFNGDTGIITPRYESVMEDWWPYPYDFRGPDKDTFYPVTLPGFWAPYVTSSSGLDQLQIIKYDGDRYTIPIDDTDCSIKVTITTDEPSNLIVYLIDPYGNVRRPSLPHYNGGEINPIHIWNGGHWLHDYDEFRTWIVKPHTEFSVEVNYPMTGKWTAIVVPYLDENGNDVGFSGGYHITAVVRHHNPDRTAAALSAANGAVIASLKHAPLLYVKKDSVPSETSDALSALGASNIIFVNINGVSSANVGASVEYKTMQEVVDAIKEDSNSENFITITSLATGEGYFAPAAMAAAYHGSPVLNIGEAAGAYDTLDKARTWCEYSGDYYHGARSLGSLPQMSKPFDLGEAIKDFLTDQKLPPIGFDMQLRWFSAIHDGIYGNLTAKYGLDREGKEAYLFVADRDTDIRDLAVRIMMGNNSYAGHIPGRTAPFAAAHIVRCILYPAVIYANPGRNFTTSQLMNFPDGRTWTMNNGKSYASYSSRVFKEAFSSHGRFYEGHCVWDNLLKRFNDGVTVWYYSGHGTGGSGISAQYKCVAEQFPYAELRHEWLKDFHWWDAWRGYMYDDSQTKSPRWGGFTWYNAKEPNLYDIIHFKWADQLLENMHCIWDLWMSCTTQAHLGPIVMLSHGGIICYGNIESGLSPMSDALDDYWTHDVFVNGYSVGEAFSKYLWLFERDFTTKDPAAMYGSSSLAGDGYQVFFGDPTMTCYSPEWTEPEPVMP